MAAPIYDSDLVVINLAETNTGWVDINQAGGGGANEAVVDFAIQGTNCIARQVSNTRRGQVYNTGSTVTLGADEHIFLWIGCSTPGITDLKSAGGVRATIGTGTTAYYDWYVNGSDTLPQGGIQNYAIYYTGSTASNTVGSPGASPQYFGGQAVTVNTSRGLNFAVDAMRRGTGFYITEGDATDPITFLSASIVNTDRANRYGIITEIPGGYALKGRFVVGQSPNGTTTASYFDVSNTSVAFTDTEFSKPDFTKIIFDHPQTFFHLNSVAFTGTGTNNPGQILVNNALTTGSFISCNFRSIGDTRLNANVQVTGSIWATCDGIYQSGSTIFNSTFINTTDPTASLVSDDPSLITFNTFEGNGEHFGIEIVVTGSYIFAGNTFTGFVSGSTSGSALLFAPPGNTGDLTLNVVDGGDAPTFINLSSGTVTINNNTQVTLTGLKDGTEIRVFATGTTTELAGIEEATDGSPNDRTFTFSLAAGTVVDIVIHSLQYVYQRIVGYTVPSVTTELPIQQQFDRNYSNPT